MWFLQLGKKSETHLFPLMVRLSYLLLSISSISARWAAWWWIKAKWFNRGLWLKQSGCWKHMSGSSKEVSNAVPFLANPFYILNTPNWQETRECARFKAGSSWRKESNGVVTSSYSWEPQLGGTGQGTAAQWKCTQWRCNTLISAALFSLHTHTKYTQQRRQNWSTRKMCYKT